MSKDRSVKRRQVLRYFADRFDDIRKLLTTDRISLAGCSGSDPTRFRQVLEQHCSSPRPRTDRPARMINYRYRETELPISDA